MSIQLENISRNKKGNRRSHPTPKEVAFPASRRKSAAIKWVKEIKQQIDTLENFPLRCLIIPEAQELGKKYRHIIYGNYRTIFRIEGSEVIIMRIIHSARLLDLQVFNK